VSQQIDDAHVKAFGDGVMLLAQQRGSRFRNAVSIDTEIKAVRKSYDQIGSTTMTKRTTRHADTVYTDTPHSRRWVTPSPYDNADLIDKPDMVRTLNEFTNPYVRAFAAAAGRTIDDIIIAQFFATATTGQDAGSTAAFPTATHVVDSSGTATLTLLKLLQTREILESFEVEEEGDENKWFIALNALQRRFLLNTTEIKSSDYNTVKALVNGQIDEFLGLKFLKSERLLSTSDPYDRIPVWSKASMKLGISKDVSAEIDRLPTKRYSTQIFHSLDMGATRTDETGVVEIVCALS